MDRKIILIILFTASIFFAGGKDNAEKNIYNPYVKTTKLIFESNFGEVFSQIINENGKQYIKVDGDDFKYYQQLVVTDSSISILDTYSKFKYLLFFTKEMKIFYKEPVVRFPLPLVKGKTWTWSGYEYFGDDDSSTVAIEGRVAGEEKIKVPAGEFTAIKVITELVTGMDSKNTITEWIVPDIGIIKTHITIEGGGFTGFLRTILGYSEISFELKGVEKLVLK
ncbi:hypothetical protein APF79_09210 [bacterium BRH_c32]|nr:MAG: hypothetical protein APF79_09210 [bacterium BRH_c32]